MHNKFQWPAHVSSVFIIWNKIDVYIKQTIYEYLASRRNTGGSVDKFSHIKSVGGVVLFGEFGQNKIRDNEITVFSGDCIEETSTSFVSNLFSYAQQLNKDSFIEHNFTLVFILYQIVGLELFCRLI